VPVACTQASKNAAPGFFLIALTKQRESAELSFQSPLWAVAAAYLLRMALLWLIHRDHDAYQSLFFPVSNETWNVASSLAQGNGFSAPLPGMQGPTAWLAPGYPAILALALKLSHMDAYAARIIGLALNCTASALTCLPIYAIGKKIFNHTIGLASCWLWVFLPMSVLFPLEWLWDPSCSAFLLAVLVWMTLDLRRELPAWRWAGYGLLWAVAVLMNPALGIVFPCLLAWLAIKRWHTFLAQAPIALAVLTFFLGVLPWTVRNYAAFGQLVPIKSNFGLEFWLGNNPDVKRNWSPGNHPNNDSEQKRQLVQLGEMNYMKAKQREAVLFIEGHPSTFAKFCLGRLADTWTGNADVPWDRFVFMLHAGKEYLIFSSAFSVLALAGLVLASRVRGSDAAPLWIAVLVFPATYYVSHTGLRYRHPIDPVLTLLASYSVAYAVAAVSNRWQARRASRSIGSPDSLVAN
jgi:4-amino-4-deoxy-L-arabinose transferase-like glycosyltransferase